MRQKLASAWQLRPVAILLRQSPQTAGMRWKPSYAWAMVTARPSRDQTVLCLTMAGLQMPMASLTQMEAVLEAVLPRQIERAWLENRKT